MAKILMIVLFGLLIQTIRSNPLEDLEQDKKQSVSKTITVYIEKDASPFVTVNSKGVPYGFDISLLRSVASRAALKYIYKTKTFDQLIPAVQADQNSIAISTITITAARQQSVDFAQYFKTGSTFLVKSSSSLKINGLSDLCGLKVIVQTGTTQAQDVANQQCTSPITIISASKYSQLLKGVQDGSAQVAVSDEALLTTSARASNGALKVVGKVYNVAPYGIACNKKNQALCCRIVTAINQYIKSGGYTSLLHGNKFTYKKNGVCPSRLNLSGSTCGATAGVCPKSSG